MGYLQKYDVFEEHWDTRETPDAKTTRDRRARMLRRLGWTVQIDTKKYNVLEVYVVYWLFAKRKKLKNCPICKRVLLTDERTGIKHCPVHITDYEHKK